MDWQDLLVLGAKYIQGNDDENTSGLDLGDIVGALQSVLADEDGKIDIQGRVSKVQDSGLLEVVSSWIAEGENKPIEPDQVTQVVDPEKVQALAQQLGIPEESAKKALADALPAVVDKATSEEPSLAEQLFEQIGGVEGALNLLKKFL